MTSGHSIPILTYHHTEQAPPKGFALRSLWVSPSSFATQMQWLARLGYTGLSMSELMPYLCGEKKGKVVGITLDDGYQSNLLHALPILKNMGFSATCYVVSGKLGQHNAWDEALGMAQATLMGVEEMRTWVDAGMEVGSHTCSHADLNQISLAEARQELLQSKSDLENLLQKPVTQFCYPYGHFSPEHESLVSQSGYVAATTTHRGRACTTDRMTALPRVPVVRSTYSPQFLLKVLTRYEDSKRSP
ncbi:MAG: polysaccharide deacetylase family protein [Betaproteobacteria bacterium]|nr:polysaccharide deacetylase family protein [Betaproteobacteria bacterium]